MYRVIVADDEPEFRQWLRSLLESSEDFLVVGEASNGFETVKMVESLEPDLVIADIYMPEPDGLEVAQYVQHNYPNIKAIIVSAHAERVYQSLAEEEGAVAFIPKTRLTMDLLRQSLQ
jgi:two-component system response regulator YesN